MFHANPEYVPGGVHNFWICIPVGNSIHQVACTPANNSGGNSGDSNLAMQPATIKDISTIRPNPGDGKNLFTGMFNGGFFTNSGAGESARTLAPIKDRDDKEFILKGLTFTEQIQILTFL